MRLRSWVLPLVSLVVLGCGDSSPSSAAAACANAARDYAGTSVGSFATTVGAIRQLSPAAGSQLWPSFAPATSAVLCYIDAAIAKGPPPGPEGSIRDPFDRVVVGLVDGQSKMILAGYRSQLPVPST